MQIKNSRIPGFLQLLLYFFAIHTVCSQIQVANAVKPVFSFYWWFLLASEGVELLLLAALIPIIARRANMPLSDMGGRPVLTLRDVAMGLASAVLCWLAFGLRDLAPSHVVNVGLNDIFKGFVWNKLNTAGAFFSIGVMAPVKEEIVFRGALISLLCAFWGRTPVKKAVFAVISSLFFAFIHQAGHPIDYAVLFIHGMIWGGLFIITGSLSAAIISHSAYNILVDFIL